jgi:hypothetical protein
MKLDLRRLTPRRARVRDDQTLTMLTALREAACCVGDGAECGR